MKIITRNEVKEYNYSIRCKECNAPYMKNNLLPEEMINILGDKIRYIPSCNCHEKVMERKIENFNRKIDEERVINKGNMYRDFSVIDERFRNSTFANAEMNRNLELCLKYSKKFTNSRFVEVGLLLYGSSGTGKTFASACIGNHLMRNGKTVMALNLGLYLNKLKSEWSRAETEILDKISKCDLLIIDDFGTEKVTEWVLEKVFFLIDARYRMRKPFIISTNLQYKTDENICEIHKVFGKRIRDRINEVCCPILFKGESKRKSPADKFAKLFLK